MTIPKGMKVKNEGIKKNDHLNKTGLKRLIAIWNQWKITIIFLFLVLLIAAVLRYLKIFIGQQPVFADEAIYVRWSQVMKAEPTLRFLPLSDGKQPLYMWILMFILKPNFDPLITGRVLSAVYGLATNIGVFVLSYLLFKSKKVSLVAALIYAISPFAIFFDSMALVDSLLCMLGLWFFILLYLTIAKMRMDLSMLGGFFLGGALLTKSPALYFSILAPVTVLVKSILEKGKNIVPTIFKRLLYLTPVFLIGYGMYNIMRLGPNFHLIGLRNTDYVFGLSHVWQNPKDPFISHIKDIIEWLWMLGPGTLVFILVLGIITGLKKYFKETAMILVWILVPIFSNAMYAKVLTARYILFAMPFIYILSALFIVISVKLKKLSFAILFLFIVNSLLVDYLFISKIQKAPLPTSERTGYLEEWTAGYGIKEVAQYLKSESGKTPNGRIVVGTEGYFGTLPDGLQIYLNNDPQVTVIGVGLDIKELPKSLKESKSSGNKTYLVINSSRLVANPKDINLKLISSFPKPLRTKGTHDYVKYGPQETLYFFEVL